MTEMKMFFFIVFVKFFLGNIFNLIVKSSIKVKIIFADTCYTYMHIHVHVLDVYLFIGSFILD